MWRRREEESLGASLQGALHVIIIGPTPPPTHGVSIMISHLVDGLRRRGVSFSHIETSDRRSICHLGKPDVYDARLFVRQFCKTLSSVLRHPSSVVYVPISQSTAGMMRDGLFLMVPFILRRPYVLHLHGGAFRDWLDEAPLPMRAWVKMLLRRASRVIVLSPSFRPIFAGLIDPARVVVVPNGIPGPPEPLAAAAKPTHKQFEVAYVGLLSAGKGIAVLLAAAARILESRPNVIFTIAGDWSRAVFRARVERMLLEIEHSDSIRFVGPVAGSEKAAIFERASVFVFPGVQQEGQPLVLLEAMAHGLPVVHTASGCAAETVGPEAGLLVRRNDVEDLAAKISSLLDNGHRRSRMGKAARARFEELFTLETHIDEMIAVFGADRSIGRGKRREHHPRTRREERG